MLASITTLAPLIPNSTSSVPPSALRTPFLTATASSHILPSCPSFLVRIALLSAWLSPWTRPAFPSYAPTAWRCAYKFIGTTRWTVCLASKDCFKSLIWTVRSPPSYPWLCCGCKKSLPISLLILIYSPCRAVQLPSRYPSTLFTFASVALQAE